MRRFVTLTIFTVIITTIGGWLAVSAQTWIMSPSPPPDNTTVRPISGGSGDNLGRTEHKATKALRFSATANPGFRLFGVGGTSDQGALQVASDKMGVSLGAANNLALKAVTTSNDAVYAGLFAVQTEGAPALVASSAGNISAQLFGLTTVSRGVIVGNNLANLLSISDTETLSAESNLYWGNSLLCNPRLPNCGWVVSGESGDGLGNHIATQTLNMNGKSIRNIGSASANGAEAAIVAVGTLASSTIDAKSLASHGFFAETTSANSAIAGLYASNEATGPALKGTSVSGLGGRSYGPLELLDYNVGPVDVRAQIQLGPTGTNRLNVATLTGAPTANLYWGDKLLCDVSDVNIPCGWAQGSGTPGSWFDNDVGIHYPSDPAGADATKGILIGRTVDNSVSTKLDIGHSFITGGTGEPSSRYNLDTFDLPSGDATDVIVRGHIAYVAANNGLHIIDIANQSNASEISSITTLGRSWGIAVSGHYVYLATTAGIRVINIANLDNPSVVGSTSVVGAVDTTKQYTADVEIIGHYLFYTYDLQASSVAGLQVIDISNPIAPIVLKTITANIEEPRNIAVSGDDLAIADAQRGLLLFRVSDLINQANPLPRVISNGPGGTTIAGVTIQGDYVYTSGNRLHIFNLADGSFIGQSSANFSNISYGVIATNDYAYLMAYDTALSINKGLHIFNVDNPTNIKTVNLCDNCYLSGKEGRLAMSGTTLYATDWTNGLRIFNAQGLKVSSAKIDSGTFDHFSVFGSMKIAGDLITPSMGLGVRGLNVSGQILLQSSGLQLADITLTEGKLIQLFTKCGASCL